MAVTHWWLGVQDDASSAFVVCRCDVAWTPAITVNGNSFRPLAADNGGRTAADPAVQDGVIKVRVTGLTSDARVPYLVDGVPGGTLRRKRQTGPWFIAMGSCWIGNRADPLAARLARDFDLDLIVLPGDFPYCNEGFAAMGENCVNVTSSIATAKLAANYTAHHRQIRAKPGITDLLHNTPSAYIPDDHDRFFDNFAPSLLWWQNAPAEAQPAATQADFDAALAAANSAIQAYQVGNPINTDANIDANATYTRCSVGPVDIFMTDCCGYRSAPNVNPDSLSKTMHGPLQKAWLVSGLNASAATWKLWCSPKQFWAGPGGNADTFAYLNAIYCGYQAELLDMLYSVRNVTGLLALGGDQHRWSDQQRAAGDLGAGYPAISMLVACPSGVDNNTTGTSGYAAGVVARDNGPFAPPTAVTENVYAIVKFTAARAERFLLSSIHGLRAMGYVQAGSNVVQYGRPSFG